MPRHARLAPVRTTPVRRAPHPDPATHAIPTVMSTTVTRRPADQFRPDIEGLRGVAVLLVVLFHAGVAPLSGGFIGVDVFFVISGFLITGLLVEERARSGRIDLAAFYARRIRRLLPAAALVVAATLPAAWVLLDPLSRGDVLLDGAAAAGSVANVRFAVVASDYFAPDVAPSPFLHFWSLAVEEQFYLVWPALVIGAFALVRRRLAVAAVVGAILAGSLALELVVTEAAPGLAFYLLPTRAWQLAAGALLAILVGRVAAGAAGRWTRPVASLTGWAGLVAVAGSAAAFDASTPYPGTAALAPTLGAAALILAGSRAAGPVGLLSVSPLRFLGRISYALYLWHWPLLVLGAAAVGSAADGAELTGVQAAALVGLAVALATLSTLLVEEPIRRGITRRPRRTIVAGLAGITACVLTATSLSYAARLELETLGGGAASRETAAPAGDGPIRELAVADPRGVELDAGASADPDADPTPKPSKKDRAKAKAKAEAKAREQRAREKDPRPVAGASTGSARIIRARPRPVGVSRTFTPGLAAIRADEERLKADRCIAWEPEVEPRTCRYGTGSFTVALVGDSHASHWFPALHAVARERNWSVVPMVKVSCPFIDLPVRSNALKREYRECARFNDAVVERLRAIRPDVTLVAINQWVLPQDPDHGKVAIVGAALGRQLDRVPGRAVLMADNPHAKGDVPSCLSKHADDISRCATPYAKAFAGHGVIETVAAETTGVPLIDLAPAICAQDPCPDVVDDMVVYRDYHHLTATFSRSLGPELGRLIRRALR